MDRTAGAPAPATSGAGSIGTPADNSMSRAIGTEVGSEWIIALGEWLGATGPGGAVTRFLLDGVVMALDGRERADSPPLPVVRRAPDAAS